MRSDCVITRQLASQQSSLRGKLDVHAQLPILMHARLARLVQLLHVLCK
jgi:hypothetical protein